MIIPGVPTSALQIIKHHGTLLPAGMTPQVRESWMTCSQSPEALEVSRTPLVVACPDAECHHCHHRRHQHHVLSYILQVFMSYIFNGSVHHWSDLLELDHDEYDHGEDVEDNQETSTDSNGQVVPEVNSFQNTVSRSFCGWCWWHCLPICCLLQELSRKYVGGNIYTPPCPWLGLCSMCLYVLYQKTLKHTSLWDYFHG